VAAFSGLSINLVGTGYTLTSTSTGLTNAISNALAVSAGTLDHITVSPNNPSVSVSGNQTYTAQGLDSANNAISGLSYIWSCTNANAGTINSSGVFTAGTAAGSYPNVIQAISGGKTGTASVTVAARTATSLAFTTQPGTSNTAAAALGTQPVVTIEDAGGNVVNTANASVILSITAGTGTTGAVLSGMATVAAVNGVAAFSGLSINLAGTGYTLTATSAGLTNAISNALAVSAGALDHITISPTNPSVSGSGNQTYTAQGLDSANNAISGLSYIWSCTNSTAGTINSSGVFTAGTAAGSYPNVIQSVSGGKTGTASVTIVARAANKLAFTTQPSTSNIMTTVFGTQPMVTVEDAGGNVVNTSNAGVTLSITAGKGANGAVLSGTAMVAAVNGVVSFSGLSINLAGTGYTLTATSTGLTNAVSTNFDITAIVNGGGNGGGRVGGGSGGGGFGGGFGGGSGGIAPAPVLEIGTTSISGSIGSDGVMTTETKTQSPDGLATLVLPKSTRFLTPDGLPGKNISIVPISTVQQFQPPVNADIIGMVYNLGPNGATFEPPVILTFTYGDDKLSDDITAKDLKIAFWDETANKWINLETENIDTVNHTITAKISHFSTYSVLGYIPAPAQFTVSAVTISPLSVKTNEPVIVVVTVSNIGGTTGSYTVMLKANGVEEGSQTVLLDGGAKAQVEFMLTKDVVNTYILDVNGQSASIMITNPTANTPTQISASPPSTPIGTQIENAIPEVFPALTTQASMPSTEITSAPVKTMRLSLFGEVIAAALVSVGLTAIIIILRRRRLLRKE
jgi:hypothetical protein